MYLLFVVFYGMLGTPHYAAGTAQNGRRLAHFPRGGELMRFTFTFYVGHKTVTISVVVKSKNRHSAK